MTMRHAFWDWSKKYGTNIKITGGKWIIQNPMWSYQEK